VRRWPCGPRPGPPERHPHSLLDTAVAALDRGGMSDALMLRRHLYTQLAQARPGSRTRRMLRRQIALVLRAGDDLGGGASGVREPRRPRPTPGPGQRATGSG
jgi:hypothetical protein